MLRFVLRRLIITVPMIFVVVSLTWGLIRLAPGTFYSQERPIPPAIVANIRAKYGLDQPWYVQYGKVIANTARGDFGISAPVSRSAGQRDFVDRRARIGDAWHPRVPPGARRRRGVGDDCRASPELRRGLLVHGGRDGRDLGAELRARTAPGPAVLADALLAAAGSLGRVQRQSHHAGASRSPRCTWPTSPG